MHTCACECACLTWCQCTHMLAHWPTSAPARACTEKQSVDALASRHKHMYMCFVSMHWHADSHAHTYACTHIRCVHASACRFMHMHALVSMHGRADSCTCMRLCPCIGVPIYVHARALCVHASACRFMYMHVQCVSMHWHSGSHARTCA
eukprot:365276-Chlamydomonas_euryale.AAC.17